ncbi:MAG: glycoside hydrolase family 3 protein [Anaerolineae bacterium]|nr:glycoside hydrolase family 3 protein [Anaerolineae bacterium]
MHAAARRLLPISLCLCLVIAAAPPQQVTEVDRLLASMTPAQRVGQLFMVSVWGPELPINGQRFIQQTAPGGVVLFESNTGSPASLARFTNALQEAAAGGGLPPLFIAVDHEGGLIQRLKDDNGFTVFPVGQLVTATGDPADAAAVGRAMAEELLAVGINMNLAPVADLETNRENPVVARRAYGSDPDMVGRTIAAFIEGAQEARLLAVAKHFPGHGATTQDSHTGLPVLDHDAARLRAVEMVPFQYAADAGVAAIMAAHIWFPNLEPEEGRPASLSYPVLTGLLREAMGYQGLIMTDALDMNAIDRRFFYGEAARLAVQAGVDLIAFGGQVSLEDQQAAIAEVIQAVEDGAIPQARIDESARRILETKARFGLLRWSPVDPDTAAARMNVAAHQRLVADLFPRALTLVKDDGAHLPPRPGAHEPARVPDVVRRHRHRLPPPDARAAARRHPLRAGRGRPRACGRCGALRRDHRRAHQ